MNRIQHQLQKIREQKKIGLMTHVVVGYPSLQETEDMILLMVEEGVDMIELQIPFSDPVADGPVILKASDEALKNGTKVNDAFELVQRIRAKGVEIPLLFMTYANVVQAKGVEKFFEESARVGIDGYIIPDMPFDTPEGEKCFSLANKYDQQVVPLFAPTMSEARIEKIAGYTKDILYAVSRTGVTGVKGVSSDLDTYLFNIKKYTSAATTF